MKHQQEPPEGLTNGNLLRWRVGQLEEKMEALEKDLKGVNRWLLGSAGALIVSLVLLVLNLVVTHPSAAVAK